MLAAPGRPRHANCLLGCLVAGAVGGGARAVAQPPRRRWSPPTGRLACPGEGDLFRVTLRNQIPEARSSTGTARPRPMRWAAIPAQRWARAPTSTSSRWTSGPVPTGTTPIPTCGRPGRSTAASPDCSSLRTLKRMPSAFPPVPGRSRSRCSAMRRRAGRSTGSRRPVLRMRGGPRTTVRALGDHERVAPRLTNGLGALHGMNQN
jgi:hypothetical protein